MISTSERLKQLENFEPIQIEKIKHKGKKYNLIFYPSLGLFCISGKKKRPALLAISSEDLFSEADIPTNSKRDKAEILVGKARKAWKSLPVKKRTKIINKMPLNSLYLAGDTI